MASTSQQDAWADFETLRHGIKSHTVDKLKQIIVGLNEECGLVLSKSGKKQELIDRITNELNNIRAFSLERWNRARTVLYQVKNSGHYSGASSSSSFTATHVYPQSSSGGHAVTTPSKPTVVGHRPAGVQSASFGRFDPTATPRKPISSIPPVHASGLPIRFKSSPFFKVEQAVSQLQECPESSGAMDRRSITLRFSLTQDQVDKLNRQSSRYQLRLYCTSSTYYNSTPGFRTNAAPCPIEFPATCEVRVNHNQLNANLKGVKKKPGTAPPADLGNFVRKQPSIQNSVEMIYINSLQGGPPKKFYLIVNLVEVTTVQQLVDRLKGKKRKSYDEVKAQIAKPPTDDDDIVAGKQTMSMKCPLSFTRIMTPSRSDKCVHPQCFDATFWYTVMEQTSTWLCPVCEKILNTDDLFVDEYSAAVLRQTSDSIDEVVIEPDGEWHTSDSKYGSPTWLARNNVAAKPSKVNLSSSFETNGSKERHSPAVAASSRERSGEEVVVLDSDSDREDEGRVKRELSPTYAPAMKNTQSNGAHTAAPAPFKPASTVIDLTLDSDEEIPSVRPSPKAGKRKADEAQLGQSEDASKRPKPPMPLTPRRESNATHPNGGASTGSSSSMAAAPYNRTLPPLPLRPPSSPLASMNGAQLNPTSPRYHSGTRADATSSSPFGLPPRASNPQGGHYGALGESRRLPPPTPNPAVPTQGYTRDPYMQHRLNGTSQSGWQ